MSDDWVIYQTNPTAKLALWLLGPVFALLVVFWVAVSMLDPGFFIEPIMIAGVLILGLLSYLLWRARNFKRPRIALARDRITVWSGPFANVDNEFALGTLESVSIRGSGHTRRIVFQSGNQQAEVLVTPLEHNDREVLRLVSLRVESLGKSLVEDISPVMGAKTGVWRIVDEAPFDGPAPTPVS